MLVLSRKVNQTIHIGDNITIVVSHIHGNRVSLGIQAPKNVRILRGELKDAANAFGDRPKPNSESSRLIERTFKVIADLGDSSYLSNNAR